MSKASPQYFITGLGAISGAGRGVHEMREILQSGFKAKAMEAPFIKVAGDLNWFSEFQVPETTPPVNMLALKATDEALRSAGLNPIDLQGMRVGVCLGSTVGCYNFQEQFCHDFIDGKFPDPEPFSRFSTSNTSQFLSRHYKLKGPCLMVSNACTSGGDAIGIASQWLKADLCDLVICGGAEVILSQIYFGFKSMMLCSPKACQPFDKNRQGLTLGEAAGILILEKENSKRNVKAKLLGFGTGSDAYHPTAPHPEAIGLNQAVQMAMKNSSVKKVDFINAHGTATPHNDLAEGQWIGKNLPNTHIVATKAYTGHTLGAAGAIEAVLTVMSLMEQKLPRSLGFENFDPEIGVAPTTEVTKGEFDSALSLSLGFGGTNCAVLLGRA